MSGGAGAPAGGDGRGGAGAGVGAEWGAVATLRRGWRASPELRRGFAATVVLALVGAAGRVAVPVLVQQSIDRGIGDPDTAGAAAAVDVGLIVRMALVAAAVIVVGTIATRAAIVRLAVRSEEALYGMRSRAFRRIHQLSLADQAEERRGALVARVTADVETLSQFFSWGGISWLVNGALMLAVVVTMAVYDVVLTVVALAVAAPLVLVLRLVQRRLVHAYGVVRERVALALTAVSEVVMGAPVIRAYGLERASTERVHAALGAQRDAQIRAGELGAYLFPSGELFSVLTVAAVVAVGVAQGPGSGLTAGALVGFIFLVYRFLEPVAEFTEILDQTQTAVAGWRRVLALMEAPIEVVEPDPGVDLPPGPPALEVDHVTFRYRPRALAALTAGGADDKHAAPEPALVDVSFRIEPATAVAVVGATGSGKTTLAKLLTRLADPSEGVVRVAGVDLRQVRSPSLRSTLVMVPQDAFLFDTTIGANVAFGRPGAGAYEVHLAFTELGLDDWLAGLPDGLATPVGERGEHLSVGERQLVALARAYVANPSCLILDEATSAVDAATEARLARALDSLARGRTSVTIAHRLSTAARADVILVFDRGRLVEQGGHEELVTRGGVYAGLHRSWLDATASGPEPAALRT